MGTIHESSALFSIAMRESLGGETDMETRSAWDATSVLGGSNKHHLNFLDRKEFSYNSIYGLMDDVDLYSAKIISSAVEMRKSVYISLPDTLPHRPSMLFASALVKHFLDSYNKMQDIANWGNPIIYFGSSIGIREQLSFISIKNLGLDFSQVFIQMDLLHNLEQKERSKIAGKLPKVITAYAPSEPAKILFDANPPWIAVDCDSSNSLNWLEPLLDSAIDQDIPVIAWAQNPLSYCSNPFRERGQVFAWPTFTKEAKCAITEEPDFSNQFLIRPVIPFETYTEELSGLFIAIRNELAYVSKIYDANSRVVNDAISIHWQCYSVLESLVVPVKFHDAEASKIWGLKSTEQLILSCSYFREALTASAIELSKKLESIGEKLLKCRELMISKGVPFWDACIELIVNDHGEKNYTLVFTNDGKKRLFQFALLAKYNLSEEDLSQKGIFVASLNSLRVQYRQSTSELRHLKLSCPRFLYQSQC